MQEKKNRNRVILLALLLVAVGCIYFYRTNSNRPLVDPGLFKVNELSAIDHVLLESSSAKIKLSYENGHWKVNDHFEADRQRITVLFATIEQAVPKRPVAASQRDSVNASLEERGVTVSLFTGSELKKQFIAGGNLQKTESWFKADSNSEAYLVTIPGYRVYVSQMFELSENEWRDKRIFSFKGENFQSLKATFVKEPDGGFTIERKDGIFTMKEVADADTSRLFSYLDNVAFLVADQIISPGASVRYDSLAKTSPIATIDITDIGGRKFELNLFPPLRGENVVLGQDSEHGLVLFEMSGLYKAIRKRAYFKAVSP